MSEFALAVQIIFLRYEILLKLVKTKVGQDVEFIQSQKWKCGFLSNFEQIFSYVFVVEFEQVVNN